MLWASSSRRSAGSSLESRRARMRCTGSRITSAATTGPNSDPRPTSSTPATCSAPAAQARFSKFSVQRSFFSRRSLAVAAETPSVSDFFDVEPDLDTESDQHLRRRRRVTQERILCGSGASPRLDGAEPRRHTNARRKKRRLLLFDFFQTCGFALEPAQVVELGAANFRGAYDVNLVDDLGVDGKDTLHALAETDLADGKAGLRAALPGNDDAFKRLQALFFAFSDLDQHFDRIAGTKLRDVGAARFRQRFFDDRIAHNVSFLIFALDLGQQFPVFRGQRNPLQ